MVQRYVSDIGYKINSKQENIQTTAIQQDHHHHG